MLAWFKKKFGKQQDTPEAAETEQLEEQTLAQESQVSAELEETLAADTLAEAELATGSVAATEPAAGLDEALPEEEPGAAGLIAANVVADVAADLAADAAADPADTEADKNLVGIDAVSQVETAVEAAVAIDTPGLEEIASPLPEVFLSEADSATETLAPQDAEDAGPALSEHAADAPAFFEEAVEEAISEDLEEIEITFADIPIAEKTSIEVPEETAKPAIEPLAADLPAASEETESKETSDEESPAPSPASARPPEEESIPLPAEPKQAEALVAEAAQVEDSPGEAVAPQQEETILADDDEEKEGEEEETPLSSFTQEKPAARSMFQRLQDRLGKTRNSFVYQLDRLFMGEKEISQELFDQLEELLITADLGVGTAMDLLDKARKRVKRDKLSDPQSLKSILKEEMLAYITASDQPADLVMPDEGPFVIMVVGINGVGKTTTIGKIAAKFVRSGQSVLLIAGDTFRAAAIDQLKIWGQRVGVDVFAQKPGADPASVVFDGIDHGMAMHKDVILIDTAGRLHTSVNLMEELKKIQRVAGKRLPGAPHEVLQVLDATTGQNGIAQAKLFHEAVGVSGLALTKLDGTAKGGIVANICRELKIPVRFIGIGEQLDDLRDFEAGEFVDALFADTAKKHE